MSAQNNRTPELDGLLDWRTWLTTIGIFAVTVGLPAVIESWKF